MRKTLKRLTGIFLTMILAIYLANASWLAPEPQGRPAILSHRGVHQLYNPEHLGSQECTATRIFNPEHDYLENTLRSMAAAFEYGAEIVEIDIHPTIDGDFVVFHDWTLNCRTEGNGVTRSHNLTYLKTLDIGYGYTADGGNTFPFRGKGVGQMPTLEEVYKEFPGKDFLINIKGGRAEEADRLLAYFKDRRISFSREKPLMIYGGEETILHTRQVYPEAVAPSRAESKQCIKEYLMYGWTSIVPEICKGNGIMMPINKTHLLWGWPNRFLDRMNKARVPVAILGIYSGNEGAHGMKTIEEVDTLPDGFNGWIWVEKVERLGPYIRDRFGER